MILLRRFVFCLGVFHCSLLADDDQQIRNIVASWDQSTHRVITVEPEEGLLVIKISYKKPLVVDDFDSYGLQLRKNDASFFGVWGKYRSNGIDGGCSGVARIGNITEDGFEIIFNLQWTSKRVGDGAFKEKIEAKWVADQQFSKNGFDIDVTVQPKQ